MNKKLPLLFLCFLIVTFFVKGEGTKQLRPTEADKGNLCINHQLKINGTNTPMYTNFGEYGAKESEQIKIRVNSISETIYFGMNNKEIDGGTNFIPNVPFRILDPNGNIVYNSIMPAAGEEGNIATWTEAVNGPAELGNPNGYDALSVNPAMTGDYVIEFNPPGTTAIDIHLFDVTVADENNQPVPGRLHSQGWQISTEGGSEEFKGKVYPYDPNGVIYEVDFNGMQPFTFVINFNSIGTDSTDNIQVNRQSKQGKANFSIPEFEVFLNPPDSTIFKTFTRDVNFSGEVTGGTCLNKTYCLNFTSDVEGYLDGYIDVNTNNIYDQNLDIHFSEYYPKDSTICVPWDGRDAQGNLVNVDNIKVIASFGLSITHLPILDVEHNTGGLKVKIVSPENLPDPLLFWDDSNITEGNAIDSKINLTGCNSSEENGCHRWEDRGSNNNPETINTWWFTKVVFDTLILKQPQNPQVNLSFSKNGIQNSDTTVCLGDSLRFYINNDGDHYDNTRFNYTWTFNSVLSSETGPEYRNKITKSSEVVVEARSINDPTCSSHDTLNVLIVDPIKVTAQISDEGCDGNSGRIEVSVINGPPGPAFTWADYPLNTTSVIDNLKAGNYALTVKDPAFSDRCALDTSFTVTEVTQPIIEKLEKDSSLCYEPTGSATVTMVEKNTNYVYNWGNGFIPSPETASLQGGNYTLIVKDPETGCMKDSTFEIPVKPLEISIEKKNENCKDGQGSINLIIPEADFNITWNNILSNKTFQNQLSEGEYAVSVVSANIADCRVDTVIRIDNEKKPVTISSILTTPSDCGNNTGEIKVQVPANSAQYEFNLNSTGFTENTEFSGLPVGTYFLSIRKENSECKLDTTITISGSTFSYTPKLTNELCGAGNGTAEILVNSPDVSISWTHGPASFKVTNLSSGAYEFNLKNPNDPVCNYEGSVTITNLTYDIPANFSVESTSYNQKFETGSVLNFTNNTPANIISSSWDFGNGDYSSETNPSYSYSQEGYYTVILTVADSNGCTGQARNSLQITEKIPCKVAIPNAFSPNGDGQNEDIGVLGFAESIDLKIFNRWGEVVFRSYDTSERWNGVFRGAESPVGVYPFTLQYKCPDANGNLVRKSEVGEINLIR